MKSKIDEDIRVNENWKSDVWNRVTYEKRIICNLLSLPNN